jgi:acyl-coenzyme A synthetase/AMP-(fatty) acid ligase
MKTSVGESAYPEQGSVYNLGQLLARNAGLSGFSDRIAVIDSGRQDRREISYRTLNERAARCANALSALGVKKGDRVFVLLPNRVETLEVLYGCFKIGAVFTPANFRFAAEEIAFLIDDVGASAVFFDTEYAETVREVLSERPQLRAVEIGGHSVASAHAYEPCLAEAAETEPGCPTAPTDTCMILFTAGTTGRPKGVKLTYRSTFFACLSNGISA